MPPWPFRDFNSVAAQEADNHSARHRHDRLVSGTVTGDFALSKEIGAPQRRIGEIVAGERAVTVDTGLRLWRFFGMSEGFWTGLQMDYDAAKAKDTLAKTLSKIKPWTRARVHSTSPA
ncbi:MAG: HigA family addiction module antidote protein [Planctomycetes bacterium]|nr:HigA family addiction module antidote protein [Planctomycetota bacterium]